MKKINLVTSQGKKMMCCAELIVLTELQYEKLTDDKFAKQVDAIAKDLKVDWSIDVVETEKKKILNVTRTTPNVIDDEFYHDLEMAADNFMSAIDKLQLTAEHAPHYQEDANEDTKKFVKDLLHDLNLPDGKDGPEESVLGADIVCIGPKYIPFNIKWGAISKDLLKEMCELYLAAHENG